MGKKDLKPCLDILKKKDKDGNRLTKDSAEYKACSVKNNAIRDKRDKFIINAPFSSGVSAARKKDAQARVKARKGGNS